MQNYKLLLSKKKFIDSLEKIEEELNHISDKIETENFISEIEIVADDLYDEDKISYEEYDRFLDSLWKLSDKAISNFNNDNIKLSDTLNMRKEKTPIQINDVVTFKKYNIYDIPRPYKIVKINDSMCILEDLDGNKFKTKLSYLDKRDSLYAEENFGKSF